MSRSRRRGVRKGEKEWAKIVHRFESSGLAGTTFCQREGLALSILTAYAEPESVAVERGATWRWGRTLDRRFAVGIRAFAPFPAAVC